MRKARLFISVLALVSIVLSGCAGTGKTASSNTLEAVLRVDLRVEQTPIAGEALPVTVSVTSAEQVKNAEVTVALSEGLQAVSGGLTWTSDLDAGQAVQRTLLLLSGKPGLAEIQVNVQGLTAAGETTAAARRLFLAMQSQNPGGGKPDVPMQLNATISPEPALGRTVHLEAWVTTLVDSPATTLSFELPDGLSLAGGDSSVTGDLTADQTLRLEADILVNQEGEWPLVISALSTAPDGSQWGRSLDFYFQVGTEMGTTITDFSADALNSTNESSAEPGPQETGPQGTPKPGQPSGSTASEVVSAAGGPPSDPVADTETRQPSTRTRGVPAYTPGEAPQKETTPPSGDKQEPPSPSQGTPPPAEPEKGIVSGMDLTAQAGWTTIKTETFEGTFPSGNWTVFDNDGATNGEFFWDDDDYKPHPSSSWSAWPANGGANWLDPQIYYYPNNADSWMVYGPFDLSDASDAELQFYYWNQSEYNYDFFGWYASPDDYNYNGYYTSGDSVGWQFVNFDLSSYVGDGSVYIAFVFTSDGDYVFDGPFVDDVLLQKYVPVGGPLTVTGTWQYKDKDLVDRPLPYARVQIWDDDTSGSDDLLGTGYTDSSGYYSKTVINTDSDESGTADIYVKVISTDDYSATVSSNGTSTYSSQSGISNDVPDGTFSVGTLTITDTTNRMAWYIYDVIANDAYNYLLNEVGWENDYNLSVRWSPSSTDGTYYNFSYIALLAGDRWDEDVILHEYGHFVMDMTYAVYPPFPNCNPHYWGVHSSLGCAWSEGWATFLEGAVQDHPNYVDTEDQIINFNMEPPDPAAHHPEDEGAVTASLWDIFDSGAETWDSLVNGIGGIWNVLENPEPDTVNEFRDFWYASSNGYNSQVAGILEHHQIAPNYVPPPPPANDDFDSAVQISAVPYTASANTSSATTAGDDPTFTCSTGQRYQTVWYRYTPANNGLLSVDTNGSGYDTLLAIWTGSRGSLTSQGCDNDGGDGTQSYLQIGVSAGQTYYIEVASYDDNGGALTLHVSQQTCYSLSTNANPGGGGSVNASLAPNCAGTWYAWGTGVQLSAVANPDYAFTSWSGDATGSLNPVWVYMYANKTVTANFAPCYSLTASVNPLGTGSVSNNPAPNCAGGKYSSGTSVALTAAPASSHIFTNWSGDVSSTSNPVPVLVDGDKVVTANFLACYNLNTSVNPTGSGTVTRSPLPNCLGTKYRDGTTVTLTANPTTTLGYAFLNWSGGVSSTSNPVPVLVDGDKNVTSNSVIMPGVPLLLSPANNALVFNYQTPLDWGDSAPNLDHYELQIATNNTFTSIVIDDSSLNTSGYTPDSPLASNTKFYWRVRALTLYGFDRGWSLVRYFRTALIPPVLLTPFDGTPALTTRPTFDWETVTGSPAPTGYNIQISKSNSFTPTVVNATVTGASNSAYTPLVDLPRATLLYWRVRTNGLNGPSAWSEVRSFTSANPPGVPILVSPASNALTTDYTPRLDWNDVTVPLGAPAFDYYQVQVSSSPAFTGPGITGIITASEFTPETDLAANTKFYWRVQSYNNAGQYSLWSLVRYFRTTVLPPTLLTPANETTALTTRPTFDWETVTGSPAPTGYNIQISKSNSFTPTVVNATVTGASNSAYTPLVVLPRATLLYWRVRTNGLNGPSAWSEVRSFTSADPPGVPILVSPASNALLTDYTPTLGWNVVSVPAGTAFDYYRVQIATDSSFTSIVRDENVYNLYTPQYTPASDLAANTKFYWRVQSYNDAGQYSLWSLVRYFRTTVLPPTLLAPDDGIPVTNPRPTFDWEAVPGATGYTLQVSRNNTFTLFSVNTTLVPHVYTPTANLPNITTFYWRVRANATNGPSAWSEVRTFPTSY